MSIHSGRGNYLHETSDDTPIQESLENIQTRQSLNGHATIASGDEKSGYTKEVAPPSVPTAPIDSEDYPDGGLRAWVIVFGVRLHILLAWEYSTDAFAMTGYVL